MKQFNELTAAEHERLAILSEECGEVVHIIGKILRHGYEDYNPEIIGGTTNRRNLEKELGDLANIISMMVDAGDINEELMGFFQDEKAANIGRYLHHN